MSYVIKNIETGKFVTPSGSEHSYTDRLEKARKYLTREAAQVLTCSNERVLSLEEAAGGSS